MDRETLRTLLARAEEHVAEGERRIERQRQIISDRRRDGHETLKAEAFLRILEETHELHVATVTLLREQVAKAK
jgi:hypothetical protein